jgi:hypothetical protein
MKIITITLLSLLISFNGVASHNVIIGGGAILKQQHGEVITTGQVLIFNHRIDNYIKDIVNAQLPLTEQQLSEYIKSNKKIEILHRNTLSERLSQIYQNSLATYPKIIKEHKKYWNKQGKQKVINSKDYSDSMAKINGYERDYMKLIKAAGAEIEYLDKVQSEYNDLELTLQKMDTDATHQMNDVIRSKYPNQKVIYKSEGSKSISSALKYHFSKPDKKTGDCKPTKSLLFVKKIINENNCVYWKYPTQKRINDAKLNSLASNLFTPYYEASSKLLGIYIDGKLNQKSSLKYKLKDARKKLKPAIKRYKTVRESRYKYTAVISNYKRVSMVKGSWERHIKNVQNKPFDLKNSSEYNLKIKEPYIEALKQYYLSISDSILQKKVVQFKKINNYKFEIENGKYLATFVKLKSPMSVVNYGIFTEITDEPEIMAQQFQNNTLAYDYNAGTPKREYVFSVVLHLIKKHL